MGNPVEFTIKELAETLIVDHQPIRPSAKALRTTLMTGIRSVEMRAADEHLEAIVVKPHLIAAFHIQIVYFAD